MSSHTPDPRRDRTPAGAGAANGTDGATRVAGQPARRNRWLIPLLAALAVLALILLLSRCRGDDASSSAATGTAASTPSATLPSASPTLSPSLSDSMSPSLSPSPADTASPSASASGTGTGTGGVAGSVVAGGTTILSSAGVENLSAQSGRQAVGSAVKVQSVPADEGFWVGSSATDRVWVQLTKTGGESGYTVKKGDTVDFTGTLTKAPAGFATKVGLSAAEGAGQLTRQGQYLKVKASSVKLSK